MKKRPAKKPVEDIEERGEDKIPPPASQALRAPTKPGEPLRVEEFPPLEEVARLSCLLANGSLPTSSEAARRLAAAALDIWTQCRDELRTSQERSAAFWKSQDESNNRVTEVYNVVNAFLSANGATQYVGADRVTWKEVISILAHETSTKSARVELERIVAEQLVGLSVWGSWTLEHFKDLGFDQWSFPSLILAVAQGRQERERAELSEKMRENARLSAEARRKKREMDEWGILAGDEKNSTSPKKPT